MIKGYKVPSTLNFIGFVLKIAQKPHTKSSISCEALYDTTFTICLCYDKQIKVPPRGEVGHLLPPM